MIKKEDQFLNNPFSLAVLNDVFNSNKVIAHRKGYKLGKNNHHLLTPVEKYQHNVFKIQGDLCATTDQLAMTRVFVARFPSKAYYLKNKIDELDYIQYHTETLVHKVHTVLEIIKLLVNEVYQLGIPPKDCSWLTLCKKIDKKSLPMQHLDVHFKTFGPLIDLRHLSSHRGIYPDGERDKIEQDFGNSLYKLQAATGSEVSEQFRQLFPEFHIKHEIKVYKKKRLKLIDSIILGNNNSLRNILTSLYPEYLIQLKKY